VKWVVGDWSVLHSYFFILGVKFNGIKIFVSSIFSEPSSQGRIPDNWSTLFEKDTDKPNNEDTYSEGTQCDTKQRRSYGITYAFCHLSGTGILKILIENNETKNGIGSKNDQA
jgi:hypothetical protein